SGKKPTMVAKKIGNNKLRSFGLIVSGGFGLIGFFPAAFRSENPRIWALGLAILLSSTSLVFPLALLPFHGFWVAIGGVLGWVNSRIILGLIYYVFIVPIGAIRRRTASDPMRRKFEKEASTYKIARSRRPASHMQRQF